MSLTEQLDSPMDGARLINDGQKMTEDGRRSIIDEPKMTGAIRFMSEQHDGWEMFFWIVLCTVSSLVVTDSGFNVWVLVTFMDVYRRIQII